MPTSPLDLLALAKQLQTQTGSEASLRGAISRAYYAALHATKNVFDARPRVGEESSHAEIIGRAVAYGKGLEPGRTDAIVIAQLMPKMRRSRNQADYDLDDQLTDAMSLSVIERSEKVLSLCADIQAKREKAAQAITAPKKE